MVIIYAERYMYASIVRQPALSSKQLKMIASIMLGRNTRARIKILSILQLNFINKTFTILGLSVIIKTFFVVTVRP